jgi:predicted DCC family thiol-disulfide oxidoreductase YuxK
MSEMTRCKTIYFDGACPLCAIEIAHYKRQEGAEKLAFLDVSQEHAQTGSDLSREKALARFHIRREDGSLLSGAAAFVAIWEDLPRWRWAARVAKWPGVLALMEIFYRLFLPLRPALAALVRRRGRA